MTREEEIRARAIELALLHMQMYAPVKPSPERPESVPELIDAVLLIAKEYEEAILKPLP